MVKLIEVNEQNWLEVAALSVHEEQKRFLDTPIGIIARGYAYRSSGARVYGIADKGQFIGAALVKNLDEEPACYDLQQFMIDRHFQNQGYGTRALRRILSVLSKEGKYGQAEVCVHKDNAAALRMFKKAGFKDTGYVDESAPDCLNLVHTFKRNVSPYFDTMISDFSDPQFQTAFKRYFWYMCVTVTDWDGLFKRMNDGKNAAFVRKTLDGEIIGFILFAPLTLSSCFFEETRGFIQEFYVAGEYRSQGHGSALLALAEKHFIEHGIYTSILTTDTAAPFYERRGYMKASGCKAKNQDEVFIKHLK